MAWRWVCASVKGTSHIQFGEKLEDAFAITQIKDESIFAVVSDGAGSARFGRQGARTTCGFLKTRFQDQLRDGQEMPSDEELKNWVGDLRNRIAEKADKQGSTPRQFAATLAAILITPDNLATMQIGDSAIVARRGTDWDVLCWPENGEYASSTYFVTDNPEPRLKIKRHLPEYDAFALFTDGVGDLALAHLEQVAHPQFFGPMMRWVDASSGHGRLAKLSKKLKTFLAGPSVCEHTDDDKTLILISGA